MRFKRLKQFPSTATARLTASYLTIIMLMSIGFSFVFFYTSSYQLGRQLPPNSWLQSTTPYDDGQQQSDYITGSGGQFSGTTQPRTLSNFLHTRINQGRTALKWRLLYVNLGALFVGGVFSYYLARRTLWPIEEAMEAQIHFVNDASHELRTPITAIRTSNDVALRNPKLTLKQAKELIRQNSEDLERLKELSEALLTLAQHDQPDMHMDTISLQEIVSESMTQVVPQAMAKDVAVHDEVANIRIKANKAALEQVLVILLDNAVKYSNKKTNVYLRTRQKGKAVYLDVVDEGIGIRSSDLPHIFRRFYRGDMSRTLGNRSGYGLGLSIAQRIMYSHDSEITVASHLGQGSTFTLKLVIATD